MFDTTWANGMPGPCNIWIAMSLQAAKYSNDEKSGQTVGKLFLRGYFSVKHRRSTPEVSDLTKTSFASLSFVFTMIKRALSAEDT